MANIKEAAKAFEPKHTKNIADLEEVPVGVEIEERICKPGTPEEFTIKVALIDGEEYRVPGSVLFGLKEILKKFPNLKRFTVSKVGQGQTGTRYTVIPLGV